MSEALDATQDTLATIAPFAALSPATRSKIVSMASPRSLQRGEILIREGERGDSLFVVVSGRLRAYVHGVGYRHAVEVLEHNSPSGVVSSPDRQMWGDTT